MNAIPKYSEIARTLAATAAEPGEPLAPERELAERFGVNRITLRRALTELEKQGVLHRRVRRGAFWGRADGDVRRRIALMLPEDKSGLSFARIVAEFAAKCGTAGWELILHSSGGIPPVDLIVAGDAVAPGELLRLSRSVPAVRIGMGPELPIEPIDQITLDAFDWGYRAARYLLSHNSRRIGYIGSRNTPDAVKAGIIAALQENRTPFDPGLFSVSGPDTAVNGMAQVAGFEELGAFDALVVFGTALPLGTLLALNENEPERYVPMIVPAFDDRFRLDHYPVKVLFFDPANVAGRLFELAKYRLTHRNSKRRRESVKARFQAGSEADPL